MSSLSQATVFRVSGLTKHENADQLMRGEFEGCPYIVNMNNTKDGDLRIFVPFDVIPPDEGWVPEFTRGKRVRPVRLRGIFSMAVCLPLPEGDWHEGEDVTDKLGFTKWIPPEERDDLPDGIQVQNSKSGYSCGGPSGINLYKYDLESLRKYHSDFTEGEMVVISEKLEGENISVVYWNDKLHVRSRNRWIAEGDNKWWNAVRKYDWDFLCDNPGLVAQGEKYGNVNKFRYDCVGGEEKIRLFDMYNSVLRYYLNWEDFYDFNNMFGLDVDRYVPIIYRGPWLGIDQHKHLAEGKSSIGENIREGFVVQPIVEKQTHRFQRIKFKLHGEQYLLAKGKMK
jgi:RNA ligase (TIGR02306 family)